MEKAYYEMDITQLFTFSISFCWDIMLVYVIYKKSNSKKIELINLKVNAIKTLEVLVF